MMGGLKVTVSEYAILVDLIQDLRSGAKVCDRLIYSKIQLYLWNICWDANSSEYDGESPEKRAMVSMIESQLRNALCAYNRDDVVSGRQCFCQAAQNMYSHMN